jgi:hypothetical protein
MVDDENESMILVSRKQSNILDKDEDPSSYSFLQELGEANQRETIHRNGDPRFDCGIMEVIGMEDELEPSPAQIDSFASKFLKVKTSFSPEKRIRLGS